MMWASPFAARMCGTFGSQCSLRTRCTTTCSWVPISTVRRIFWETLFEKCHLTRYSYSRHYFIEKNYQLSSKSFQYSPYPGHLRRPCSECTRMGTWTMIDEWRSKLHFLTDCMVCHIRRTRIHKRCCILQQVSTGKIHKLGESITKNTFHYWCLEKYKFFVLSDVRNEIHAGFSVILKRASIFWDLPFTLS